MQNEKAKKISNAHIINFDRDNGKLEFSGYLAGEASFNTLTEVIKDLNYCKPPDNFDVNVNVEYFSSSNTKQVHTIFKKLKDLSDSGSQVRIKWLYELEDDDIYETGEDFSRFFKLPFEFVELK